MVAGPFYAEAPKDAAPMEEPRSAPWTAAGTKNGIPREPGIKMLCRLPGTSQPKTAGRVISLFSSSPFREVLFRYRARSGGT